jgi:hypothetical protein
MLRIATGLSGARPGSTRGPASAEVDRHHRRQLMCCHGRHSKCKPLQSAQGAQTIRGADGIQNALVRREKRRRQQAQRRSHIVGRATLA